MSIGETHALRSEFVDVGRGDFSALGVVTLDIAIAEIIGEDDYDVRFR